MVRKTGSYLPGVYEEIVKVVKSYVLTLNDGLYMTAEIALTDGSGKKRWFLLCTLSVYFILIVKI